MNSPEPMSLPDQPPWLSPCPTAGSKGESPQKEAEEHKPAPANDQSDLGQTRIIPLEMPGGSSSLSGIHSREVTKIADSSLQHDSTRFGDFILVKKIGAGAMASVYKAKELSFNRTVALKILHPHVAENSKLVERFYREARTAGHLDHPNIVQGYGVGEYFGYHYFNMEYIRGKSLQEWLERRGQLPVSEAVRITIDCAKALAYAHSFGVIHRDIKPENVLITTRGLTKIADLGMVKDLNEGLSGTQTGHAVGTPWYMPLEQARNAKEADHRCDIYALGCMLYCLLVGSPPFTGSNIVEILDAKTRAEYVPAWKIRSGVPKRLDQIIVKMVAREAADRFSNCNLVVKYLQTLEFPATENFSFATSPPSPHPTPVSPSEPTPIPIETPPTDQRNQWFLRVKNSEGRYVVLECETQKIIRLVRAEKLSPSTKVSRSKNKGFRALATYKEFEAATLGKATKTNLDLQTSKYRELCQQISHESSETTSEPSEIEDKPWYIEHRATICWGLVAISIFAFLSWVCSGIAELLQ
ncbi:MAG: serine/threonine protein kinase [Gemmataceae bacterium]